MNPELTEDKSEGVRPSLTISRASPVACIQDLTDHTDPRSDPCNLDNSLDKVKGETTETTPLQDDYLPHENTPFKILRTVSFSQDVCDSQKNGKSTKDNKTKNKEQVASTIAVEDDGSGVPYDRGWAWMVDLGCFLLFFVYISHDHWHSILLMDYLQEFHISVPLVTVMLSLGSVCYCVATQVSTNVLVKRYSIRVVVTMAAIANAGVTLLFAALPNVGTFFIVNFIKFTAKGVTLIATLVLVGFYFRRRRGLATTLGLLGVSASFVCAPPLIRYLREEYGFRGCFLILSGLEMHGILAALLLRPISSYTGKKVIAKASSDESDPLIVRNVDDLSDDPKYVEMLDILEQLPFPAASSAQISIAEADEVSSHSSNESGNHLEQNVFPEFQAGVDTSSDIFEQLKVKKISDITCDEAGGKSQVESSNCSRVKTNGDNNNLLGQLKTECLVKDDAIRQTVLQDSSNTNRKIQNGQDSTEGNKDTFHSFINSKSAQPIASETNWQRHISQNQETSATRVPAHRVSHGSHTADCSVPRASFSSNWSLVTTSAMGSMLNIAHVIEPEPDEEDVSREDRLQPCSWIHQLIDVSLLKNYLAMMIAFMYILVNTGMFSIIYLPSYAIQVGVSSQNAALLLTVVGSMDMVGRLFFGFLVDLKLLRPHLIIAYTCLCIGTVTHFVVLFTRIELLYFFSVMQGLLAGVGPNLTTVLIVDVVGIKHLGLLLPMSSMFYSFSFIIQHPIQGTIIEATGSFVPTYHYVGTSFILAAILLFCEPLISKLQRDKESRLSLKQSLAAA